MGAGNECSPEPTCEAQLLDVGLPVNTPTAATVNGEALLVAGDDDGIVRVWDRDSGKLLTQLEGHTDWVNAIDVRRVDGTPVVASGSNDGAIRLWDLARAVQLAPALQEDEETVNAVRLLEIGATCSSRGLATMPRIRIRDVQRGVPRRTLTGRTLPISALALWEGRSGPLLISGGLDAVLRALDPVTGNLIAHHVMPEGIRALATPPDGRIVVGFGWEVAAFQGGSNATTRRRPYPVS